MFRRRLSSTGCLAWVTSTTRRKDCQHTQSNTNASYCCIMLSLAEPSLAEIAATCKEKAATHHEEKQQALFIQWQHHVQQEQRQRTATATPATTLAIESKHILRQQQRLLEALRHDYAQERSSTSTIKQLLSRVLDDGDDEKNQKQGSFQII